MYPPIVANYPVTIVDDINEMVEQLVLNGNTSGSFWYQNYGTVHVTYSDGGTITCPTGQIAQYVLTIDFN